MLAGFDPDEIWEEATADQHRTIIEDLHGVASASSD
jgi:hypothetical protein